MTISSLFIRRPRLAFVVSTVITIAGLLAITALPVAQFPDIVPPQVRVTATYPGASAQAVEESVAQVIEGQVNGVERMIYMQSTSTGSGTMSLTVTFEIGTNPDQNAINVNQVGKRFYNEFEAGYPNGTHPEHGKPEPYVHGDWRNAQSIKFKPQNYVDAALAMNEGSQPPDYGSGPTWAIFDAGAVEREEWDVELAGEGSDLVNSSISYTDGENVE